MLRKILKKRVLVAAINTLIILAIAFSPAFTRRAAAKPDFSLLKIYYSDATYTTEVGEYWWPCVGQPSHWGVTSAYVDVSTEDC
jgi:hypothetical protein